MRIKWRLIWTVIASVIVSQAFAQMYTFSETTANSKANVFFGSSKDSDGHLLIDVTVSLDTASTTYVVVTDNTGHFHVGVPKDILPKDVRFSCSKPGFVQIRAVTRPPPDKRPYPVQADCVLQRGSGVAR